MGKRIIAGVGILLMSLCIGVFAGAGPGRAATWNVEKWNMKQTKTVTKGAFTFKAHLSNDKKEAWVYLVEATNHDSPAALDFPKEIQKAKVTKIGADMTSEPLDELDFYQNVFGIWVEHAHEGDGYCKAVKNVTSMTLPETVTEVEESAFSGMRALKKVKIPGQVKELRRDTFYGCRKLQEVSLPKKLSYLALDSCFDDCPELTKVTLSKSNKKFTMGEGALLSKNKKKLIWVVPGRHSLTFPKSVRTIASGAFFNCQVERVHIGKNIRKMEINCFSSVLRDVTVDRANPVYARDGQCIYRKSDKAVVVGIAKKQMLKISDKVKRIPREASICGQLNEAGQLEVLDIPASVSEIHEDSPVLWLSTGTKVYFRRPVPPKLIQGSSEGKALPIFCEVYVPAKSLAAYKNWYKKYDCYSTINKGDWHTLKNKAE